MSPSTPSAPSLPPLYRLGFAVKVRGAALPSHDSRRWQNRPHLSVSLAYLRDIFAYLHHHNIRFYRLAGQLAPYLTHPALPAFHHQIDECSNELANLGDLARQYRLRLTMHLAHFIQLSSAVEERVRRSLQELEAANQLMTAMGIGDDGVIVVHVGGAFGDAPTSRERFARQVERLSEATRRRLAVENDDRHFGLQDVLWIERRTGIRVVLDTLHHRCFNPSGHPLINALALALGTWPASQTPKIHFSSPRTALRTLYRERQSYLQMPLPNQHSDFIDPFALIDLLRNARSAGLRPFDLMLEAKAQELALLRLREQIATFAPDLARVVV